MWHPASRFYVSRKRTNPNPLPIGAGFGFATCGGDGGIRTLDLTDANKHPKLFSSISGRF